MNKATLNVDLRAVVNNWRFLKNLHNGEQTAAVVKANAYGLGAYQVSIALANEGCERFFVATLSEALELRSELPNLKIYVFQGVLKGEESEYIGRNIHPVINTISALKSWFKCQSENPNALPAAIHIDSGMNRLGLNLSDLKGETLQMTKALKADLLMTHYASASDLDSQQNAMQLAIMEQATKLLPHLTTCYANSAAHFLPTQYHGEVTRPGCALYGINPLDNAHDMMQPVATLSAPILQIRTLSQHETVGYGATETLPAGSKIITAGIGYADGIHRTASHRLHGFIGDYRLPQVGRITMDMTCYDASQVPSQILEQATHIEIMNQTQTVNDLARIYKTIGYEVLTSISSRVVRNYIARV
jgi:alanine racemase